MVTMFALGALWVSQKPGPDWRSGAGRGLCEVDGSPSLTAHHSGG